MAKILIADDDRITRRVLAECVTRIGHQALQCSDGRLALAICKDNPDIRLLIADVMMPGLDGISLVAHLRAYKKFDDMSIIMISGIARPSEIADLLDGGVSLFMPKPLNVEELRRNIDYGMRVPRPRRQGSDKVVPLPDGAQRDAYFHRIGARIQKRLVGSR